MVAEPEFISASLQTYTKVGTLNPVVFCIFCLEARSKEASPPTLHPSLCFHIVFTLTSLLSLPLYLPPFISSASSNTYSSIPYYPILLFAP